MLAGCLACPPGSGAPPGPLGVQSGVVVIALQPHRWLGAASRTWQVGLGLKGGIRV